MPTLAGAQKFVQQRALELFPRRNGGIAWDIEAVLCEDDRTSIIYCEIGDGEWLAACFDGPRGKLFDPAHWEQRFAAGFASITAITSDAPNVGTLDLVLLSQPKSEAARGSDQ